MTGRLALGTANFGTAVPEATAHQLLQMALDHGVTTWDTADTYGPAEEIIGRFFVQHPGTRARVRLSTKVGNPFVAGEKVSLAPWYLRDSLDRSLRRLQTDYVDTYFTHNVDPSGVPIEATMEALMSCMNAGKVQRIGCANLYRTPIPAACTVVQNLYNILDRSLEQDILPRVIGQRIEVLTYSPLAGGVLTAKYRQGEDPPAGTRGADYSFATPGEPGFLPQRTPKTLTVAQEVKQIATRCGVSAAVLALRWVLACPSIDGVIVGARTPEQFAELLTAPALPWSDELEQAIALAIGGELRCACS